MAPETTHYRVRDTDAEGRPVRGIDYPPGRRAEPGDVVGDLPAKSVRWLLSAGIIEAASAPED